MIVTFILLNKTKPVGGDVEVTVYSEKGLMAALDALKDSVESGKFQLKFQNSKLGLSLRIQPTFIVRRMQHPARRSSRLYSQAS